MINYLVAITAKDSIEVEPGNDQSVVNGSGGEEEKGDAFKPFMLRNNLIKQPILA